MVSTGSYTETKLNLRGPNNWLYSVPLYRQPEDSSQYLYTQLLLWSKRGSGKSVGSGETFLRWAKDYPGSRFLVLRVTRTRLTVTWQKTFDSIVLPAHGMTRSECYKASESTYRIGDSEIILAGMDDPARYQSFEGNAVLFVEGTEFSPAQYDGVIGSLRWSHGLPWHGRIIECNPASPFNFVHQRFIEDRANWSKRSYSAKPGMMAWRLTHHDNPAYYDDDDVQTDMGRRYEQTLEEYTNVEYRRMVLAEWAAAQGALFGDIELDKCLLKGAAIEERDGFKWVVFDDDREPFRLGWFSAGFDHGHQNPMSFTVWGHEAGGSRKVCVAELYHTNWNEQEQVDRISEMERKWGIWRGVGDPAAASPMTAINKRILRNDGRPFLINANKSSALSGATAFAQAMYMHAEMSRGNILYMEDTLAHPVDPELVRRGSPTRAFEELPGLMWAPPTESKRFEIVGGPPPVDEIIKKDDHGYDGSRYMFDALKNADLTPPLRPVQVDAGIASPLFNNSTFRQIAKARGK